MKKDAALLWEPAAEQRSSVSVSRDVTGLPASNPDLLAILSVLCVT
jgi:hypothetical protein